MQRRGRAAVEATGAAAAEWRQRRREREAGATRPVRPTCTFAPLAGGDGRGRSGLHEESGREGAGLQDFTLSACTGVSADAT